MARFVARCVFHSVGAAALLVCASQLACGVNASKVAQSERDKQSVPRPQPLAKRPAALSATAALSAGGDATPAASNSSASTLEAALPKRRGDMLLVPAGSFSMGSDEGGEGDEHPAHQVTLAAFYLDQTEVTNLAYQAAVDAGICVKAYPRSAKANGYGSDKRFRGPRQPVSSIAWEQARAYCAWRGKRLPSEAEWERAARGDDGRRYPWGDDEPTPQHARYATSVTADVGSHPHGAGPFGHLDLAGNVWEWVADIYDPYAYLRPGSASGTPPTCDDARAAQDDLRRRKLRGFTGSNPIPTECERVLRGGAFNYFASGLRMTNRVHHPGRYRLVMSGFRCAQDVTAK